MESMYLRRNIKPIRFTKFRYSNVDFAPNEIDIAAFRIMAYNKRRILA